MTSSASPHPGALSDRLTLFGMSDRTKLRFAGPQALWFLDQLVTNKVDELPPGSGAEALLLTPNGRITSHLRILHKPDSGDAPDVFLDAPSGHADQLLDFFGMRVFATKVSISDISPDYAILRVLGAQAEQVTQEELGIAPPGDEEHESTHLSLDGSDGLAVRSVMPARGVDLWIPKGALAGVMDRLTAQGAEALSQAEYESLRILAGVARFGTDFDDGYLPQEAALERAVHYSKGCYLGQEAVAMAQRGRIKRRVRHLEFEAAGGTGKALYEDREVGRVTSAAEENGKWFGIGTVKTDVPLEATVKVLFDPAEGSPADGVAAVVRELPGTTYGPHVPSARELREKLQGG